MQGNSMTRTEPEPVPRQSLPWEVRSHEFHMLHVRLRIILTEVMKARPRSLFEIGCSVGAFRKEILSRLPGLSYAGCDISQSAVDSIGDPNVVRIDLNADPLPFADRTFDCVVGSGILEYVKDVPGLLRTIRGRMPEGGRLCVSYFNMRHIYRKYLRARGKEPFWNPTWHNDYSIADFRDVVRGAGFRVVDEIPSNLGLKGSPCIGDEKWKEGPLRAMRRLPFVFQFAHQVVFVGEAVRA